MTRVITLAKRVANFSNYFWPPLVEEELLFGRTAD
jgi:hypothetical protein